MANFIRIYANDIKIRSTGKSKWYREHILESFGFRDIECDEERAFSNIKNYLLSQNPFCVTDGPDEVIFKIVFVHRTKCTKHETIIADYTMPYGLKRENDKYELCVLKNHVTYVVKHVQFESLSKKLDIF